MICARLSALPKADFGARCEFDLALLRLLRQGRGKARIYARAYPTYREGLKVLADAGRGAQRELPAAAAFIVGLGDPWLKPAGAASLEILGFPWKPLENPWDCLDFPWIFLGINFDFLVRIEPFQGLARTPRGDFLFLPRFSRLGSPVRRPAAVKSTMPASLNSAAIGGVL